VRSALLVDFGGVLTSNVFTAFEEFCEREGLRTETVRHAFLEDPQARELLFDLELGRLEEAEFERRFAAVLGVDEHEGLIGRLFAGMHPDAEMADAVGRARELGVRTGLISNSWGDALVYDEAVLDRLFDGIVISSREGLRKPDPAIYALGAQRIGAAAEACVFVDDLPGNLKPARAMGMATVHHTSAAETIPQLEQLLGVGLR